MWRSRINGCPVKLALDLWLWLVFRTVVAPVGPVGGTASSTPCWCSFIPRAPCVPRGSRRRSVPTGGLQIRESWERERESAKAKKQQTKLKRLKNNKQKTKNKKKNIHSNLKQRVWITSGNNRRKSVLNVCTNNHVFQTSSIVDTELSFFADLTNFCVEYINAELRHTFCLLPWIKWGGISLS